MSITPCYLLCAQKSAVDPVTGLVSVSGVLDCVRLTVGNRAAERDARETFLCHLVAAWSRDAHVGRESEEYEYDFISQVDGLPEQLLHRGTFRFRAGVRVQRLRVTRPEVLVPHGCSTLRILHRVRGSHLEEVSQVISIRVEVSADNAAST